MNTATTVKTDKADFDMNIRLYSRIVVTRPALTIKLVGPVVEEPLHRVGRRLH